MNCTVDPLACSPAAARASSGVSFWHGPHHEAKKLSTTGWWLWRPSADRLTGVPPVSDGRVNAGATSPTATTGPELGPVPDLVPRPTKRTTARAAAITQPMIRERSRRGPVGDGVGAAAGGAGGPPPSAGGACSCPASVVLVPCAAML